VEEKKIYEEVCYLEIDHEETVGIRIIFNIISCITGCIEVAKKTDTSS